MVTECNEAFSDNQQYENGNVIQCFGDCLCLHHQIWCDKCIRLNLSHCNWLSVSQSGLVLSSYWVSWSDFKPQVWRLQLQSSCGVLSNERVDLSFVICLGFFPSIFTFFKIQLYSYSIYNYTCTIYTWPLPAQVLYTRLCHTFISICCNGSLVTWTAVSLTTTEFKSLIFSVLGFALSDIANIFIFVTLYDFYLLPA
jgi:hypothetical protein